MADPVSLMTAALASSTKNIISPRSPAGIDRPTTTTTQAVVYMYAGSGGNDGPYIPTSGATVGRGQYSGTITVAYNQGNGSAIFAGSGTIANAGDTENLCQLINSYLAGNTRLGSIYALEWRLIGSLTYGGGATDGAWGLAYGGPKGATWNDDGTLRPVGKVSGLQPVGISISSTKGFGQTEWTDFSNPSGTPAPGSATEHTWQIWAANNSAVGDQDILLKEYEIQVRLRGRESIGSTQLGVSSLKLKGISLDSGDKLQLNNDPTLIFACTTPGAYDEGVKQKDKTSLTTNMEINSVKRLAGCPLVILEY